MTKIIFIWWLVNGTLTPVGEHEGRIIYHLVKDEVVAEFLYKEEIINYIETDEIVYNDYNETETE